MDPTPFYISRAGHPLHVNRNISECFIALQVASLAAFGYGQDFVKGDRFFLQHFIARAIMLSHHRPEALKGSLERIFTHPRKQHLCRRSGCLISS
jgi:hypothetical protein